MMRKILTIAVILVGLALPAMGQNRTQQKQINQDQQIQKMATVKLQEKEKFRGVSAKWTTGSSHSPATSSCSWTRWRREASSQG